MRLPDEPEAVTEDWEPPVLQATASTGEGVDDLAESLDLDKHFAHLEVSGELTRRRQKNLLGRALAVLARKSQRDARRIWEAMLDEAREALLDREASPYEVAARLYERLAERRQERPASAQV